MFDFPRKVFQAHDMTALRHPVKPVIGDLVAMVAEGYTVVLAFKRVLADPAHPGRTYTTTWFDMFRIANGRIASHRDCGTRPA